MPSSKNRSSPLDLAINPLLKGFEGFGGKNGALGGVALFQLITLIVLIYTAWKLKVFSK